MANVFLGIYVTMSMWYKLSGETKFGAYFSILGALITIVINVVLIPHIHYYGSAIATLCCYLIISLVSYQMGQKHFPVPYQPKKVFIWILSASILFGAFYFFNTQFDSVLLSWILRIAIILIFTSIVLKTNPEILRLINKRKAL
jgi:O-antigen/teichoic acid export membrane protein